jgi:hypothetical protein
MTREEAKAILGVTTDDLSVVKAAFRSLSKKHHPDAGGDIVKFQELNDAYQLLLTKEDNITVTDFDLYADFIRRAKKKSRESRDKTIIRKTVQVPIPDFYTRPVNKYRVSYKKGEVDKSHEFKISVDKVTVTTWSLPEDSDVEMCVSIVPQDFHNEVCSIVSEGLDVHLTIDKSKIKDYYVTPIKGIVVTKDSEEYSLDLGLSNGRQTGKLYVKWK